MGKLVDVVGFPCQFTEYVCIRLADTLYNFPRKQYGMYKPTEGNACIFPAFLYRLVFNICKSCADHTHLVTLGLP